MKPSYIAVAACVLLSVVPVHAGTVIQNSGAPLAPADIPDIYAGNLQIKELLSY
jgi:hypothetical protein